MSMATIEKKTVKGKGYFYLRHSIKVGDKVIKKEKYLGKELPDNIEEIKKEFEECSKKEQWFSKIDNIKKKFNVEFKAMPRVAKEKYLRYFAIKFTYNTDRIEGSTLTLKETADLLEEGISPKKPVKDIKEAQSHDRVFYDMFNYKGNLKLSEVLHWHKMLFKDTEPDIAGIIRRHNIRIARSEVELAAWPELDSMLHDFFKWYNRDKNKLHPLELAALVHLKFVTIHPFSDGNGRISRILMNFILKKYGYPMLNIPYTKRDLYYNALEHAQTKKDDSVFVKHVIHRYLKEYKDYL